MPRPLVLVIEDEPEMRNLLGVSLTASGYRVTEAASGDEGLLQVAQRNPDLIVLDLGLPGLAGIDVARRVRAWSTVPIIVLSARDRPGDKVEALDAGADDYLTKPFSTEELLARVRVALRHGARVEAKQTEAPFRVGDLEVNLAKRRVFVGKKEVHLTPITYKLLVVLVHNAGRVVTHRQLLKEVWGPNTDNLHYVRIHMKHLRHKLETNPSRPRFLITEPGVGYRLLADEPPEPE
jgi:two-component system, OmpR family, KDP operon response regulator KdpE